MPGRGTHEPFAGGDRTAGASLGCVPRSVILQMKTIRCALTDGCRPSVTRRNIHGGSFVEVHSFSWRQVRSTTTSCCAGGAPGERRALYARSLWPSIDMVLQAKI